jgi:hypothetical protein
MCKLQHSISKNTLTKTRGVNGLEIGSTSCKTMRREQASPSPSAPSACPSHLQFTPRTRREPSVGSTLAYQAFV